MIPWRSYACEADEKKSTLAWVAYCQRNFGCDHGDHIVDSQKRDARRSCATYWRCLLLCMVPDNVREAVQTGE